MAQLKEDFYRCSKCENAWFIETRELLLRKDPPEVDVELAAARVLETRYVYRCASCLKPLKRRAGD